MSVYKRGKVYWYDFWFQKRRHQGSTKLRSIEKARMYVAKLRTDLALGLIGLTVRPPAPRFKDFLETTFLTHIRQTAKKPRTASFYADKVARILEYEPFTRKHVDQIDELAVQDFKEWCGKQKKRAGGTVSIAEINGRLRTLRRAIRYAKRCKLIIDYPLVSTLPGEKQRTFTLTGDMENAYLTAAAYPLREIAILMLDLGLRTDEAVSLKLTDVTDDDVTIWDSKTDNGRRAIPQTARTREVFKTIKAFRPNAEYVFPGRKGHLRRGTIDNLHTALRDKEELPKEFVLYSCRHTFGTRLAESGASAFEIKEAMGHSSVKVSERYIHPSSQHLAVALKRKELMDRIMRGEAVEVPTKITTAGARDGGNPHLV